MEEKLQHSLKIINLLHHSLLNSSSPSLPSPSLQALSTSSHHTYQDLFVLVEKLCVVGGVGVLQTLLSLLGVEEGGGEGIGEEGWKKLREMLERRRKQEEGKGRVGLRYEVNERCGLAKEFEREIVEGERVLGGLVGTVLRRKEEYCLWALEVCQRVVVVEYGGDGSSSPFVLFEKCSLTIAESRVGYFPLFLFFYSYFSILIFNFSFLFFLFLLFSPQGKERIRPKYSQKDPQEVDITFLFDSLDFSHFPSLFPSPPSPPSPLSPSSSPSNWQEKQYQPPPSRVPFTLSSLFFFENLIFFVKNVLKRMMR